MSSDIGTNDKKSLLPPACSLFLGRVAHSACACACALLLAGAPLVTPCGAADAWAAKKQSAQKSTQKSSGKSSAKNRTSSGSSQKKSKSPSQRTARRGGKPNTEQFPSAGIGSFEKPDHSPRAEAEKAKTYWTKDSGPCLADGDSLNLRGTWKAGSGGSQSITGALQGREGRTMRLVLSNSYGAVLGYALLRAEHGGSVQILQSRDAATQKLLVTAGYACLDSLRLKAGASPSTLQTGARLRADGPGHVFEDHALLLRIGGRDVRQIEGLGEKKSSPKAEKSSGGRSAREKSAAASERKNSAGASKASKSSGSAKSKKKKNRG